MTRIDNCSGNEGVSDGATPQGESGYSAISQGISQAASADTANFGFAFQNLATGYARPLLTKRMILQISERTVMET